MNLTPFFQKHWDPSRPVLLGLSGGSDSMALLYLLRGLSFPINIHLVHIDHGWREESAKEALILQKLAQEFHLPFHLKTCRREEFCGNLEDRGRQIRLAYFRDILAQTNAQAVLLAHHLNDATEGVFKRFFESAPFYMFSGLKPVNVVEGVPLWRPLLDVPKQALKDFLQSKGISYFEDATNLDPRFLRGRIRSSFIPNLSQEFGKNIVPSLETHRKEAEALADYLDGQIEPHFARLLKGPFGECLDLNGYEYWNRYELKTLLDRWFGRLEIPCSKKEQESFVEAVLQKKGGGVKKRFKELQVIQDRGWMFICRKEPEMSGWTLQMTEVEKYEKPSSWIAIWQGRASVVLPVVQVSLGMPSNKWDKKWTAAKVPAFLRSFAPVLFYEGEMVHEFLTGKQKMDKGDYKHLIQLEYQGASLLK